MKMHPDSVPQEPQTLMELMESTQWEAALELLQRENQIYVLAARTLRDKNVSVFVENRGFYFYSLKIGAAAANKREKHSSFLTTAAEVLLQLSVLDPYLTEEMIVEDLLRMFDELASGL